MTPLPSAAVRIRLRKIELGPDIAGKVRLAKRPYLIAYIGDRRFGRSGVVSETGIDLDGEPMVWEREVRVSGDEHVNVIVVLHDEASDVALGSASAVIAPPWTSGSRAVEDEIGFSFDVATRRVPDRTRVAPRSAQGTTTFATLRLRDVALVEIADVRGVYKPVENPGLGEPPAVHVDGYTSQDDRGRVYLNRDLEGRYARDVQTIEISARIHVLSGRLPADAKVRWTVIDVDDPSNDDPNVHPEAGIQFDPKDYDPANGEHLGSAGRDNRAKAHDNGLWPDGRMVWSDVTSDYPVTVVSGEEATTPVFGGWSKIAYSCPDCAGDTFVVRAEVVAPSVETFADETGILTMWHLVDIEYVRMKSARAMQLHRVLGAFATGFIEARFTEPRMIEDQPYVGRTNQEAADAGVPLVRRLSRSAGQGGWFTYVEALEGHPVPAETETEPFVGEIEIHAKPGFPDSIEIPRAYPEGAGATFQWKMAVSGGSTRDCHVQFKSEKATVKGGVTRIELQPHDLMPQPLPGQNGPVLLFLARQQLTGFGPMAGGYGIPEGPVYAAVSGRAANRLLGVGGEGLLIAFTRAYAMDQWTEQAIADDIDISVVHEFTHAFLLPHKCGHWDRRVAPPTDEGDHGASAVPRRESCLMNYSIHWLFAPGPPYDTLLPNTQKKVGLEYCGRHIDCLRNTHLEDIKELKWK